MQTATSLRPVGGLEVEPAVSRDTSDRNPTATRYGWCPFKNINLMGADGTVNYYVQPHEITVNGVIEGNPYHRALPKGQLIPFPTFNAIQITLSEDLKDSKGSPLPVSSTRAIPALEAITVVLRDYSMWGFTMIRSLQGVDQDVAQRIFRVVHPFEYRMRDLPYELSVGAEGRINSVGDLRFDIGDNEEYVVEALRSESEKMLAREVAAELAAGAELALTLAEATFSETDISIKTRLSGGNGKFGPDPLDKYLADELGKEFVNLATMTGGGGVAPELGQKVDFLVDREVSRGDKERIAELEAQLAAATIGQPEVISQPSIEVTFCGRIKRNGEPCKSITKDGAPCFQHEQEQVDMAA